MAGKIEFFDGTEWVATGDGTVSSITAGAGLTGGTITSSGTIALSDELIAPGNVSVTNGYFVLPSGPTSERPETPILGMIRINTDL